MDCSMTGFLVLHYLPEFAQTHVHWVNYAIQPCHLLLPPSLPALNLTSIRIFFNESALHISWPKYWSFSFSISLSSEYSGLISYRIDWFDLLAVQGTLKSLLHHYNLKASVLHWSAFFIAQFSHPYMTIGKTIVLTIWIFVGQVMSLLFNTLSFSHRVLVLPKSNHFFKFHGCSHHLQWFWSSRKKKICHCFQFFPFYYPWNDGIRCHDLSFLMLSFKPAFSGLSYF